MKQKIWALSAALLAAGCTTDTDISAEMTVESGNAVAFSSAPTQSRTEIDEENGRFSIRWSDADQVGMYSACPDRSAGDNFTYRAIPAKENATRCVFSPAYADEVIEWQELLCLCTLCLPAIELCTLRVPDLCPRRARADSRRNSASERPLFYEGGTGNTAC